MWQPCLGIAYHLKPTNTVLRASYSRTFETPYNENLILSSVTGGNGLADGTLGDATAQPLRLDSCQALSFLIRIRIRVAAPLQRRPFSLL